MPGCDKKIRKLADALVDAKKKLNGAGVQNFKFEEHRLEYQKPWPRYLARRLRINSKQELEACQK